MKLLALALILTACSNLSYMPDGDADYWQSPAETHARGGGDCEDLAIEAFFWHEQQGAWLVMGTCGDENHMIAVWDGGKYDVANCASFQPLIYFNRACYHRPGRTGCGNAQHIVKWRRITSEVRINESN